MLTISVSKFNSLEAMDWSSCIISVDSPHKDCKQVHKAFLQNVEQFKELDALPVNLKFGPEVTS